MATFVTVIEDDEGNPREVVSDLAALEEDLRNPLIAVYVFVGARTDPGWKIARSACALFALTRPWLVTSITPLRPWVPVGAPAGIVFGYDGEPDQLLTEAEAVILKIVRHALLNAI